MTTTMITKPRGENEPLRIDSQCETDRQTGDWRWEGGRPAPFAVVRCTVPTVQLIVRVYARID